MDRSIVRKPDRAWMLGTLALLLVFLLGCNLATGIKQKPTDTPQAPTQTAELPTMTLPASSDTPAAPQEVTPTPIPPSATAEVAATETSTPVAEVPTETPSASGQTTGSLASNGQWLIISTSSGIWAANADGTGLTQLSKEVVLSPTHLQQGISPDGKSLAFVSGDADRLHHLQLSILSLPDGAVSLVTPLTSQATEPGPGASPGDPVIEAVRAVTEGDSLAWSPDGNTLAFIGVQSGPTADLYTYSLATQKIDHLSDGPSQAYGPHWSPDGKYILTFGVTTFGTGAGFTMAGGWAQTPDGAQTITLFQGGGTGQEFGGWVNDHSFLINSWNPGCGSQDLRAHDLSTNQETSLVKGCFAAAAVKSDNGLILVAGSGDGGSLKGLVSYTPPNFTRQQLSQENAQDVQYLPQDGGFVVAYQNIQTIYTGSGEALIQSPPLQCTYTPAVAAYGALYAWTCAKGDLGVWVNGPGVPTAKLFDQSAAFPAWSAANELFFFNNQTLYQAPFPDYTPKVAGKIQAENILDMAWAGQP